jgi:hypothetical protein
MSGEVLRGGIEEVLGGREDADLEGREDVDLERSTKGSFGCVEADLKVGCEEVRRPC